MNPWALVAGVVLVLANGFFVWAEFALLAARSTRLQGLVDAGSRRARIALRATSDLNLVLAGAQLGITMASLGLGFVAEPAVGDLLAGPLEVLPDAAVHTVEVALALVVVVAVHIVFGEMVPKNLAIADPERSALWIAAPFRVYMAVFRPVIAALTAAANAILRLFGVEPRDSVAAVHGPAALSEMLKASRAEGLIESVQHGLLSRALQLQGLDAGAIMVPRPDVEAVPVDAPVRDVETLVVRTGHSRIPLYAGSIDDIAGFVHVKDLLRIAPGERDRPIPARLHREMLVTPESRPLLDLLADMRVRRLHFAVVVDEHGATAGVVTLEDVLEEMVGEIRDEYDPGAGRLVRIDRGRALVSAGLRPDELERALGLTIPDGDYETLAGFVMWRLGSVPSVGDAVEVDGWTLVVHRMQGRRVETLEVVAPSERE